MIVDDVIWEVINNGFCSYKSKYIDIDNNIELRQIHFVGTLII